MVLRKGKTVRVHVGSGVMLLMWKGRMVRVHVRGGVLLLVLVWKWWGGWWVSRMGHATVLRGNEWEVAQRIEGN